MLRFTDLEYNGQLYKTHNDGVLQETFDSRDLQQIGADFDCRHLKVVLGLQMLSVDSIYTFITAQLNEKD